MTTRTQHTATPPPHVDYAEELRRITKGKRGAFSRVENEAFGVWLTAQRGTEARPRVTEEDAAEWLKEVQQHTRRTWPGKAAYVVIALTIFIVFALGAINEAWRLYGNINTTQPTVAPLPTAVVPLTDKTDQHRATVADVAVEPAIEPALAPVVKEAQEVAKPAPVVTAPVVSESDKAHQVAPGTAERVNVVESTPEAQKGAQGRSGGEREETVKGGREK